MKRFLQINPENQPADWDTIEHWRDAHEISPIDTTFGPFHADPHSVENRMLGAIERFDILPTLNEDGTLTWKQPGQVYRDMTREQLEQAYNEIKTAAAIRSAELHAKAEQFRLRSPRPSANQLRKIEFWLGEEV